MPLVGWLEIWLLICEKHKQLHFRGLIILLQLRVTRVGGHACAHTSARRKLTLSSCIPTTWVFHLFVTYASNRFDFGRAFRPGLATKSACASSRLFNRSTNSNQSPLSESSRHSLPQCWYSSNIAVTSASYLLVVALISSVKLSLRYDNIAAPPIPLFSTIPFVNLCHFHNVRTKLHIFKIIMK